ncbi:MAG: TlyA family RNA methyltransferase [Eubacteriales bacterium]|nr:TlyA family RNA methyltransferase [Eubacteriales bacterium]
MRLDVYLVESGLMSGRDRAKEKIRNGEVLVNGKTCGTPSFPISEQDKIELIGENYFSRGERKLEHAFARFDLSCAGKICLDVGASTGGFTYCMLNRGAAAVYAVDVGSGQLREELRRDPRVHNLENQNARFLTPSMIGGAPVPFIVMDVSFISQCLILPAAVSCLTDDGDMVTLLKPQFECGGGRHKHGVIKDARLHLQALETVGAALRSLRCYVKEAAVSPIRGGDGNTEYLLHIRRGNIPFDCKELFRDLR